MTKMIDDSTAGIISDIFKEINGFRPRFYDWSKMTQEQGDKILSDLIKESNEMIENEWN